MNVLTSRLVALTLALGLAVAGVGVVQVATAEPAQAAVYTNCFASSQYSYSAGRVVLGTYCKRWPSNFYERMWMKPGEYVWIPAGNHG